MRMETSVRRVVRGRDGESCSVEGEADGCN